jgi:hypothetical protein
VWWCGGRRYDCTGRMVLYRCVHTHYRLQSWFTCTRYSSLNINSTTVLPYNSSSSLQQQLPVYCTCIYFICGHIYKLNTYHNTCITQYLYVVGEFVPRDRQGRMSVLKLLVRCSGFVAVDFVSPRIEGLEKSMLCQTLKHLEIGEEEECWNYITKINIIILYITYCILLLYTSISEFEIEMGFGQIRVCWENYDYRFKLGGHMFQNGDFSVLYKHKSPRIFIGFSKVS